MIAFDASSFSERMGNGRSPLCRVGEPVKGFTRSNHPAKCRKEKRRNYFESKNKTYKAVGLPARPCDDCRYAPNHGAATNGKIFALGDLNIKVESNSSFTTSVSTTSDNLYGIQADNGKLNIFGPGTLTVTANGKGDVYGIYADKGVTISAPLNVQVGKNSATENRPVYGIYTKSGEISLSGNDMTVTATGGTSAVYGVYNAANTSTAITNNGNIDIRGKLTVNLYNGGSNDGIRTDGGGTITLDGATVNIPSNFGTGIYNFKGNVVIENGSNVTLSSDTSYGIGIYARYGGDLTIENSTVTVSAKRLTASVEKGGLTIKDSIVDLTLDKAFYCVVETANNAANKIDLSTSGSVTLTASGNQTGSMIGGTVSITTPGTKCVKGTYYDYGSSQNYDGEYDGSSKTVLQFVHEDPAPATYTVSFDANGGTGTMADVTDVSGEYTLPANGFTAPAGKQFKAWSVGGVEKAAGDKITVTANTTVTAVWEDIPVVTYTVSGTATSFGSNTDNVILQLIAEGYSEADYEVFVKGNTASYSIAGVLPGTYTMKVMKNNHVTREYTVVVGNSSVIQDVEIWLLGDVNGDGTINVKDKKLIFNHLNDPSGALTGYALDVGDVNRDGTINVKDKKLIFNHLKGTSLWS